MAAANAANSTAQNDRMKKATQVTAVADGRIQAVIVSAPKDLMDQIAGMMHDLDVPSPRDQNVYVYHLDHGDPNQVVQVLQNTFGNSNTRSTTSSQQGALANPRERRRNLRGKYHVVTRKHQRHQYGQRQWSGLGPAPLTPQILSI